MSIAPAGSDSKGEIFVGGRGSVGVGAGVSGRIVVYHGVFPSLIGTHDIPKGFTISFLEKEKDCSITENCKNDPLR